MRYTGILILFIISSCETGDDIASFIKSDTKKYNEQIAIGISMEESWISDPILITHKLFIFQTDTGTIDITVRSDTVDTAQVTITQEGPIDDAVSGEKRIIEFKRMDGKWTISSIKIGFKCWEHRGGHTNYSGINCS